MKNQSDFFVHAQKDGVTESFGPGDDIPSWVKIDNPYVSGKKDSEDEPQFPEPDEDDEPKRRPARKAASGS